MKKRTLAIILSFCILLTSSSCFFENVMAVGAMNYIISGGEAIITYCNPEKTSVTIPSTIDGYPVTEIGDYAFEHCNKLTNITIPESVETIGEGAFFACTGLTSITIPGTVKEIGTGSFGSCIGLNKLVIKNGVQNIGDFAFEYCIGLTSIIIPDSVKKIGGCAFAGCSGLRNVIIENGVEIIEREAFIECINLSHITLPATLTQLSPGAFLYCNRLENVYVDDKNMEYCSDNGVVFTKDRMMLVCYPPAKSDISFNIPNGTLVIDSMVFTSNRNLKKITVPESVEYINPQAFADCYSLENIEVSGGNRAYCSDRGILFNKDKSNIISYPAGKKDAAYTIPKGVVGADMSAFHGCVYLESITIPGSMSYLGDFALGSCKNLTDVIIQNGVLSLGLGTFEGCTKLRSVIIPGSVKTIDDSAFIECTALVNVSINDGVERIGIAAFALCKNLTSVIIPKSVTNIDKNAFGECSGLTDVYYSGNEEEWNNIKISTGNNYLKNATVHYNVADENVIILSKTSISAVPLSCGSIYAYKTDGKAFEKGFSIKSTNPSVVTTSKNGNEIVLEFNSFGSAEVIVSATDGSGNKAVCSVNVGQQEETEDSYLLKRFALSGIVYSNDERQGDSSIYNLVIGRTIGDELQKANKNEYMFYLDYGLRITWEQFYKNYINDYKVIKLPINPTDGFYAAAFESPEGDIIIAYRGTEGLSNDLYDSDLKMVFGVLSEQFPQALDFYDEVKQENPDKNITLTGHSLGGSLASYVAANRNVRCDNINGATGLICSKVILDQGIDRMTSFEGFDKYIYENYNSHPDLINSAVTKFRNYGCFNYKDYNYSEYYNNMSFNLTRTHNHHGISSVINYNYGSFGLTEVVYEHFAEPLIKKDYYIGTSHDNTYIAPYTLATYINKILGFDGSYGAYNSAPIFYSPNYYILAGAGDDTIILPESGNDTLIGNGGNDVLNGGAGNDMYVFGGDFGNDTIIDPSGIDIITFTDATLSDITVSGDKIRCGSNQIELSNKLSRRFDYIIADKNNDTMVVSCSGAGRFSLMDSEVDTPSSVRVVGNVTVEIYNSDEELVDTLLIDDESDTLVEYKEYGMVSTSPQALCLTIPPEGYIVKVTSDEVASVMAISDADNPTVAKQTYALNKDLSNGSEFIVNTGKMNNQQLSVKLLNGNTVEEIYSEAPGELTILSDKDFIKVGETITMSVPDIYAGSVEWECSNQNVEISKNEDMSVSVTGIAPGQETVKAYIPNDESYTAEFSFEITQDDAPCVDVECNGKYYNGESAADESVVFNVTPVYGYDTVVFNTTSPYIQTADNEFVIDSPGSHCVKIYYRNSITGAKTESFKFNFFQDTEAPLITGAENGALYYTDRVIEVSDTSETDVFVNGELCKQQRVVVSGEGVYNITATDKCQNITEINFEIKSLPDVSEITKEDAEFVNQIRSDFEEIKYSISSERMTEQEEWISRLEYAIHRSYDDEATPFMSRFGAVIRTLEAELTIEVSNASDDAFVYVASYDKNGRLLEVQQLYSETEIYKAIFSVNNASVYKAFLWDVKCMPFDRVKSLNLP